MALEQAGHLRSSSENRPPSPSQLQFVRSVSTDPRLVRETSFAVRKLDSFVLSKPLTDVDDLDEDDDVAATVVDDADDGDDDDDDASGAGAGASAGAGGAGAAGRGSGRGSGSGSGSGSGGGEEKGAAGDGGQGGGQDGSGGPSSSTFKSLVGLTDICVGARAEEEELSLWCSQPWQQETYRQLRSPRARLDFKFRCRLQSVRGHASQPLDLTPPASPYAAVPKALRNLSRSSARTADHAVPKVVRLPRLTAKE